ncbi:AAA family ATPase [Ignisphaera sp. 4213-co]|uniref:AAA family ATPase n=1 Tax=Ignisphaera cupida TaxID=3050454 RepID=A0ABD4Z5J8_9CREN|nr:AAA family ATPase [Ignisphaera sp. 4213-co]MDK6028247.1 AAA family ATPase [Ignisphaera sp. 4213-co]
MSGGREYLEALARKYVHEAMINEKIGNKVDAAKNYKKAAEIIMMLINNYKNDPMIHIYKSLAESYINKAKELEEESKLSVSIGGEKEESEEDVVKDYVLIEKPSVRFEDVIGLDNVKQAIMDSIVYPTKRPDLFPLGWPRNILLYGPPGCGKTLIAAAVANEIDGVFMQVDAASLMSKWLGEAEKRVAAIFKYARKIGVSKPVIIFIDEADGLLGVYESEIGGEARVRNQFLKELDGLSDKGKKFFIYVIAATNKPWKLDIGFLRRFQKRIYVPPPNKEARRNLFEYYTKFFKLAPDVDFNILAEKTEGYSASDIRDIVLEAYLKTVRELFKSNNFNESPRPITLKDFMEVLQHRKPSISQELLKLYEEWGKNFGAMA